MAQPAAKQTPQEIMAAMWEDMQAQVLAAIAADQAQAAPDEEVQAALDEGLAPMPPAVVALRTEKLALDAQIDELTARKKAIQEEVGKQLDAAGLVGFVFNGKVRARVTNGTRSTVDGKKLKEKHPKIWAAFLKTTPYRSVNIT